MSESERGSKTGEGRDKVAGAKCGEVNRYQVAEDGESGTAMSTIKAAMSGPSQWPVVSADVQYAKIPATDHRRLALAWPGLAGTSHGSSRLPVRKPSAAGGQGGARIARPLPIKTIKTML